MTRGVLKSFFLAVLTLAGAAAALPRVVEVKFVGNRAISRWELYSALTIPKPHWYNAIFGGYPPLNSAALQNDLGTIKAMYQDRGFLDVRTNALVKPLGEDTSRVRVMIYIDEGAKYFVGRLELRLPPGFDGARAHRALGVKRGDVFSPFEAEAAKNRLWRWIADQGYPYAKVTLWWGKSEGKPCTVDVHYSVDAGKKAFFGKITYKGLRKTKKFLLRRELAIKSGEPYSYSAMEQSKEELYSTGLFRIVSVELADTFGQPETVDVVISVVERARGWYGLSFDFGSDPEYDLTVNGSVGWGHRNIFGNGQSLTLRASSEAQLLDSLQLLSHRYEVVFYEPWTFARKLPSTLTLYFEPGVRHKQEPWRVQKLGGSLQLVRRLGEVTHWGGITYERADVFGVPPDQAEEIKQQQGIYISRKLSYTYQRDKRDDVLMPKAGSLLRFEADFVGGPLGGDEHYFKFELYWTRYIRVPFWRSAVYASRLQMDLMGSTKPGSTDVAVHNRLSLGGANTVRGFSEKSIGPKASDGTMLGGKVLALFSAEVRFPLVWKLWGHLFLDAGQVWWDWRDVNPNDVRISGGFGFALATPVGPIRADYGAAITRLDPPPYSRWHITLMYPF